VVLEDLRPIAGLEEVVEEEVEVLLKMQRELEVRLGLT
jgi:hypothetical protein